MNYRTCIVVLLGLMLMYAQPGFAQEGEGQEAAETAEQEQEEPRRRGVRRLGDVVSEGSDEWSMDSPVAEAPPILVEEQPDVSLPDPQQDSRLQNLLTRRAFVPEDPSIEVEMDNLLAEVQADAEAAIEDGDYEHAARLIAAILVLDEERPGIDALNQRMEQQGRLEQLVAAAEQAYEDGRLVEPDDNNALAYYREVLDEYPENETALAGLANVQQRLLSNAIEQATDEDFEAAEQTIDRAAEIHDDSESVADAREAIAGIRQEYIESLRQSFQDGIASGELDDAERAMNRLIAMGHGREAIDRKRRYLEDARLYGGFEAGQVFSEELDSLDASGPRMVVVPAGDFMMGSPDDEEGRSSNEGPRHRVTFERGFAMSETETTVGEFRRFIQATGYRTDAERVGSSRTYNADTGRIDASRGVTWQDDYMGDRADDNYPVLHVSWNDASAYAEWLSRETSRNYRLPSEAEYEYALRAGTQSMYWWGEGTPDNVVENLTGDGDISPTRRRWNVAFNRYSDGHFGPAPAGSFEPNPFQLYDMGGNVMAWVEDCWHDSYARAPADGSAWVNPGCNRRVLRGGNWSASPQMVRSAFRLASAPDSRDARVGFRVARDL